MVHLPSRGDLVASTSLTASTLLGAIFVFVVVRLVYWVWIYPFFRSPLRHLPKPKNVESLILGQLPRFLKVPWVPHLFHEWSMSSPEGPFIRYLGFGNAESLFVNSVTAYREVLQTKSSSFVKPSLTRKCAEIVIGDGLPFSEGHVHRHRRGVLNKFFSISAVKSFLPVLDSKAKTLVDVMAVQRDYAGEVEVESLIWRTVLDVIGIKVLGEDLDHLTSIRSNLHDLFSRTMQQPLSSHIIHYLSSYLPLRHLLPIKANREFLEDCEEIRDIIRYHVSRRDPDQKFGGEEGDNTQDMIQQMLEQGNMSQDEVVEYVLNFMVLGHDTTACSLVWAVHCLAQNPACQERLRGEMSASKNGLGLAHTEVDGLRYLDNFLKEVLRVYCPVAYVPRETIEEVEVSGVVLPKGTVVQLCPAVINLSPSVWGPDAEAFNPDRWDNLKGEAAGAYAFQTFHNGPRVCIGKQLSMVEMKVILVELVSRFRVEAAAGAAGRPVEFASPSFTLRPKEKLRVRLVEAI